MCNGKLQTVLWVLASMQIMIKQMVMNVQT